MTKSAAERGHSLHVEQGGQGGQPPGRHDGHDGGEHDRPSRQRAPHRVAHFWRHDRLDQLIGAGTFGVADQAVEEGQIDRNGSRALFRVFGGERQGQQRPEPPAAQPIDDRDERAAISKGAGDRVRRGTEMLGQQPVA